MKSISPYSSRSEVIKLGILLLALTGAIITWDLTWRWDKRIYDTQSILLGHKASDDVVIVAIDELSLKNLGRWPWSRRIHAQLVDTLTRYETKAIILDIIFSEPNTNDLEGDRLLANAIQRNGKVILPVLVENTRLQGQFLETLPLPALIHASAALGHVHVDLDIDGIARRAFLYEGLGEAHWPHIALSTLQLLEPANGSTARWPRPTVNRPDTSLLDWIREGHFLIPFVGPPGSFQTISYSTILDGNVTPQDLKNKIVLVGATSTGLGDVLPTPVSGQAQPMSGVEINANILQALQTHTIMQDISLSWQYLLTALYVLLPIMLFPYLSPRLSLIVVFFSSLLLALTSYLSLLWAHIWIPISAPFIGLLLTYPLWTWRRLEFTVRFFNSELERLASERKGFQNNYPLNPDDAATFIQSIVPLQGAVVYDLNGSERLKLGDVNAIPPNIELDNTWRRATHNHYWSSMMIGNENLNVIVNWNQWETPPSEPETLLITAHLAQRMAPTIIEPKSAVELIESRIRAIEIATDNLAQIRQIVSNSLEQMADGVLVINRFGQIILTNHQAAKFITGDENANISQQTVLPLLSNLTITTNDSWPTILRAALIDQQTQQRQARSALHLDLLVSVTPLITLNDLARGFIINFSDITELKNAERRRNEVLEFLSHDLRSPLVSIIALAEHSKSADNQEFKNIIHNVENHTNRAIQLAEDFVHLSRVESNDEIEFNAIELENVASNAVDAVWDLAKAKRISINQCHNGSTWIRGNGSILERTLINLLNNAIKYSSPQSNITLSIDVKHSTVQCCVEDNGIGIPEDVAESIFDRFTRVNRSDIKQQPGIGLGLAFVKASVERHHGKVTVKSTLNQGSRFCITLPMEHSINHG